MDSAATTHATTDERGNTYDKYGSTNPVERRLMDGFFAALDAALPATPPARILEVGAGEGAVSARVRERFPEAALTVVDLPDAELAGEWRARDLAGSFADIGRLPFVDDTFDLVLAIEVLEHVPGPERGVAELARVASDRLVLSVPREPVWRIGNLARFRYVRDLGNTPGHVNHWSSAGFERFVGRHLRVDGVRRPLPWTVVSATVR